MYRYMYVIVFCDAQDSLAGHYEEKLIDHIFNNRMYNKLARPVKNESEILLIKFGLALQQIIDVVRPEPAPAFHSPSTNSWIPLVYMYMYILTCMSNILLSNIVSSLVSAPERLENLLLAPPPFPSNPKFWYVEKILCYIHA